MPTLPTHRAVFEGEIATYWFEDDGILVSLSRPTRRTVERIAGNVALVKQITNNTRVPLLIYLSRSPVPDAATAQLTTYSFQARGFYEQAGYRVRKHEYLPQARNGALR